MSPEEGKVLVAIARAALAASLRNEATPAPPHDLPPRLLERGSAFVTLRNRNELRGCLGRLDTVEPLWKVVQEMAAAAGAHDPRFMPVRLEELSTLSIEVSALSPLKRARPEEVSVGTHGLCIRQNGRSGLLLPQVAVEWGWDRAEFLRQTCRKAELGPDAWLQPATEIYSFTAERFHD